MGWFFNAYFKKENKGKGISTISMHQPYIQNVVVQHFLQKRMRGEKTPLAMQTSPKMKKKKNME